MFSRGEDGGDGAELRLLVQRRGDSGPGRLAEGGGHPGGAALRLPLRGPQGAALGVPGGQQGGQ